MKLPSSTDELHSCCQANARFAQTLKQAFRGSLGESGYIEMNGAYNFSNLETCKDLAVVSRLTVVNSSNSELNIYIKEGEKKKLICNEY